MTTLSQLAPITREFKMHPLRLGFFHRWSIMLSLVVVLGAAALLFGQDIATWYVKLKISVASNPEEEFEAFRLANKFVASRLAHSYRVEAFDVTGREVKPTVTGDYFSVASVRITWLNGQTFSGSLLNPQSLDYIFGE